MFMNTASDKTVAVKDDNCRQVNDSQFKCLIDDIINKNPEEGDNNMIEPFKSSSMINAEQKLTKDPNKEPVQEILSVHETARKMNIIPQSDESDEDESIDEYPSAKKRKFASADVPVTMTDVSKFDDDLSQGSETGINKQGDEKENEDVSDYDNDDTVLGRGNEKEDESDDDSNDENISNWELKDRLHRSINRMRVFEVDLDGDKALSNIDLLEYIDLLKVPKFRGVFHRDELPKRINAVECGIVNLSPHEQLGTHWVCYAKVHKTRIYFDSFGRKTPLEIQMYMKTAEEFRNNDAVIERSTSIVQRVDTSICGHLCLYVLTSLMRERLSFQQVMDQLNYAFAEHFYW